MIQQNNWYMTFVCINFTTLSKIVFINKINRNRLACGRQYNRKPILPRQRGNFSGDAVEYLS
jgi:hypothetical protein